MTVTLPAFIQSQIDELTQTYGQPLHQHVSLNTNTVFDPISLKKKDRYGEVCMVIRRKNGKLLLMRKSYYPAAGLRLPTGGIKHGEAILDALLRETAEETSLKVAVQRFLVLASYQLASKKQVPFYSFAFLVDEVSGTLASADPDEMIEEMKEIEISELPGVANTLSHLEHTYNRQLGGDWHDWGEFRAAMAQLVWQALEEQPVV